jgi:hypothetical protein
MRGKKVGLKTLAWFDDDGLPVSRLFSALPDQDEVMKAFIGQTVQVREISDNSIEIFAVQEKKSPNEKVGLQEMTQKQLLVHAAKLEVDGVDGRSSKPNIIAAIRKSENAKPAEQTD